jgi:gag-polypeptide of LTR copia-type
MSQQSDSTKLTTIILNGSNYIPWSRSVTIGLGGKGKLNFVTETKEKPKAVKINEATAEETEKMGEWETTDRLIMSWLLSTMEPRISNVLMYSDTSKEIWDKAKRRYGQQRNFAHIFSLKQELSQIKQNGQSTNELVTKIMSKWEELNVYLPPTTDPNETQKRSEQDLIFTYLGALDTTYEVIRSQILASAEMPNFDDVVARIQQEESRRALMNPQPPTNTDNRAFRAHPSNPNLAARAKGTTAADWCDHCKRTGHNREGCWVLHPHLRPSRNKGERGGARKGGTEQRFGGISQGTGSDLRGVGQGMGADQTKPTGVVLNQAEPTPDPSGSSVASTAQLNQLLTQLNSLLQQQTAGFVHSNTIGCEKYISTRSSRRRSLHDSPSRS